MRITLGTDSGMAGFCLIIHYLIPSFSDGIQNSELRIQKLFSNRSGVGGWVRSEVLVSRSFHRSLSGEPQPT